LGRQADPGIRDPWHVCDASVVDRSILVRDAGHVRMAVSECSELCSRKREYLEPGEACTPSLHKTHNQIPSRQFMLRLWCESRCDQRSRLSTGGHFMREDQDSGYPCLSANGHPRSGKRFARTTARRGHPLCQRVARSTRAPEFRAFPMISSGFSKSCRILILLARPGKHRVTRGEPRPIWSPALRFAVSRVAAVDSERQSLIQEAITAGAWVENS
jgi:hypothetical protein